MSWAHFHDQFAYFDVNLWEIMYLSHARNYGHTISSVLLILKSVLQKLNNGYFIMKFVLLPGLVTFFSRYQCLLLCWWWIHCTLTWNSVLPEAVTSLSSQPLPMTAEKQATGCTKSFVSCRVEIHIWRLIIHISNTGHDMTSCYQVPWGLLVSLMYGWWHIDSSASRSGWG